MSTMGVNGLRELHSNSQFFRIAARSALTPQRTTDAQAQVMQGTVEPPITRITLPEISRVES